MLGFPSLGCPLDCRIDNFAEFPVTGCRHFRLPFHGISGRDFPLMAFLPGSVSGHYFVQDKGQLRIGVVTDKHGENPSREDGLGRAWFINWDLHYWQDLNSDPWRKQWGTVFFDGVFGRHGFAGIP